jgi:hypothetical protein
MIFLRARHASVAGAVLLLVVGPRPVSAREASDDGPSASSSDSQPTDAERAFALGREAMRATDFEAACRRFEESERLSPAPGTILNLALCEERLARVRGAATHFEEFLARVAPDDDRRDMAQAHLAAVRDRLPHLVVRVAGGPLPGGAVELDGRPLASADLGVALAVEPGAHALSYRVPGRRDTLVQVIAVERRTVELVVGPGPRLDTAPSSPSAPRPAEAVRHVGAPTIAAGLVTGVGAASLVASLVSGAVILDRKRTVAAECHGDACTQAGVDAARSGKVFDVLGTVTFAVGIAGIGAGTYLYLSSPTPAAGTKRDAGGTLSLSGRF